MKRVKLQVATKDDVADLVSLHTQVSQHLTSLYGIGHWSLGVTGKGVLFTMTTSTIYIVRYRKRLVATLSLSTRRPRAIDKSYFTAGEQPLYLTAMAVSPLDQRKGIGRLCLHQARIAAQRWPASAIRLDAYDAEAGAGGFYARCGFHEAGRASYKGTPLIYFELLL